jgi:sirohydrochlorin cobaltochelatase
MSQATSQSLILFAHGARDPAWAAPFERLRALTQAAMPGPAWSWPSWS